MDKYTDPSTDAYSTETTTLRRKAIEGGLILGLFVYTYKYIERYILGENEDHYLISWIIYMILFSTIFTFYSRYR